MRAAALKHRFVTSVPEQPEEGILYVSLPYRTAIHRCCCGCGHEVVTPFSPTDWQLTFDGVSVSLYPSIGNWSLACRSHYWIKRGKISWAGQWTDEEIEAGRAHDRWLKDEYYGTGSKTPSPAPAAELAEPAPGGWWRRISKLWS
jgi:hypothetical protein